MFGDWLGEARRHRGLSQAGLAATCQEIDPSGGFAQTRVSEWERHVALPSFRQLVVLLRALACTDAEAASARSAWEAQQVGDLPLLPNEARPAVSAAERHQHEHHDLLARIVPQVSP